MNNLNHNINFKTLKGVRTCWAVCSP